MVSFTECELYLNKVIGSVGKESAYNAGDPGLIPVLPGESHGQKSVAGYSSWGCTVSDMTEQLTLSLS